MSPTQGPSRTKQNIHHTGDLTRIPLYTQLAWGNQPPPWLRLPMQRKGPHEGQAVREENAPPQGKENTTGLPDTLKASVEQISGLSMDDVQVHYNSSQPAQVQALAYTQGTEIHVGPGQEKHLAHEAWHVVQQKQGRVKPTIQAKGMAINDDRALEKEADRMGDKASQPFAMDALPNASILNREGIPSRAVGTNSVIQKTSAVVASQAVESQLVQTWLQNNQNARGAPAEVADGEILWIVGHDTELGDGRSLATAVDNSRFISSPHKIVRLIVCYAGNVPSDALSSPAQNIANILRTPVQAATTLVTAQMTEQNLSIGGNFTTFNPQTEEEQITSQISNIHF